MRLAFARVIEGRRTRVEGLGEQDSAVAGEGVPLILIPNRLSIEAVVTAELKKQEAAGSARENDHVLVLHAVLRLAWGSAS